MRYSTDAIRQFLIDQADSDLSVARFCAEHDLKVPTFYNWRKKYGDQNKGEASGFCKIVPRSETAVKKLHLPSGLALELSGLSTPDLADLIVSIDRLYA